MADSVLKDGVTWPLCRSRGNVAPLGESAIKAFPLGLVKPLFASELVVGAKTRERSNIAMLIALLCVEINKRDPELW